MSAAPTTRPQRHLAIAVAVAVLAVAASWWLVAHDNNTQAQMNATQPTPATPAECGPVLREPTNGAGAHVDDATYDSAPPSFGDHADRWAVRPETFYDDTQRPDVSLLVHNLEHGYNILWYDQTVLDDQDALSRVQDIANLYATLDRSPDPATAFIAVPWTQADGAAFPPNMHYALWP